jgi:hypothetical protein
VFDQFISASSQAENPYGKEALSRHKHQTMNFQEFVSHPLLQIINSIFGIWGGLITIYVFRESKKSLKYNLHETSIFDEKQWEHLNPAVSVLSTTGKISRLTRCYLFVWNDGRKTINFRDDISEIRLHLPSGSIPIHSGVVMADDDHCRAKTESADHRISIEFDYLLPGDGIIFFVDHDGEMKAASVATFHAKLRKLSKSFHIEPEDAHIRLMFKYAFPGLILFAVVVIAAINSAIQKPPVTVANVLSLAICTIGVVGTTLLLLHILRQSKRYIRARLREGTFYYYMTRIRYGGQDQMGHLADHKRLVLDP